LKSTTVQPLNSGSLLPKGEVDHALNKDFVLHQHYWDLAPQSSAARGFRSPLQ
jgi:hypothetical protein